ASRRPAAEARRDRGATFAPLEARDDPPMDRRSGQGQRRWQMTLNDPVAALVARLDARGFDPRATGPASHESRCPAHNGDRRNLTITRGDDGRALVHCHAHNCPPEAIAQALEMELRDLFPSRDGPPRTTKAPRKPRSVGTTPRTYPTAQDAIAGT